MFRVVKLKIGKIVRVMMMCNLGNTALPCTVLLLYYRLLNTRGGFKTVHSYTCLRNYRIETTIRRATHSYIYDRAMLVYRIF